MKGTCFRCGAAALEFTTERHLECSECGSLARPSPAFRCAGCAAIFDERAVTTTKRGILCGPCAAAAKAQDAERRKRRRETDEVGSDILGVELGA